LKNQVSLNKLPFFCGGTTPFVILFRMIKEIIKVTMLLILGIADVKQMNKSGLKKSHQFISLNAFCRRSFLF